MRVMTYNVRSLRDSSRAVVRVIRAADPDVVCIQEAPRFALWWLRCALLALRCRRRWVAGGRAAGANLLLVRPGIRRLRRHDVAFSADPGLHLRGAAIARLAVDGRPVVVAGTHLDLATGPRLRHVDELRAALAAVAGDVATIVVAGDVNETPGGPAWTALCSLGVDAAAAATVEPAWTFPADEPLKRIDGVFVSPASAVRRAEVLNSSDVRIASDHRPVLVEVSVP